MNSINKIFERLDDLERRINKIYKVLDEKKIIYDELNLLLKYTMTQEECDKLEQILKTFNEQDKNDASSKNIFEYNVYNIVKRQKDNPVFPMQVARAYSSTYSNVYKNFYKCYK